MALDAFAADILNRCRIAQTGYGGHPSGAWSGCQQLAVALVLRDWTYVRDYLKFDTKKEAEDWLAASMANPPADMDAWLDAIRAELEA